MAGERRVRAGGIDTAAVRRCFRDAKLIQQESVANVSVCTRLSVFRVNRRNADADADTDVSATQTSLHTTMVSMPHPCRPSVPLTPMSPSPSPAHTGHTHVK